jgi:hypothetical protein
MGEWQKIFVSKLVEQGIAYETAMLVMAWVCEAREKAYMEGYDRGFAQAFERTKNEDFIEL